MLSINEENDNYECVLCLESSKDIFYNYNYENNKYIHNCECKPYIHYNCFKTNYKKNKKCIICLELIERKINTYEYLITYFKISRIKNVFMILILLSFIYSFFNLDLIIDKNTFTDNDYI